MIAHLDMDCFFAACEEKYNPELKGEAVVVGALPTDKRGVVATANYKAREFGIHSAMPISKAYRLCPNAKFVKPTFGIYKKESEAVMNIIRRYSPIVRQVSVDEAYFDLSHYEDNFENVAKRIQSEILTLTKLTCSIGLCESKYVAKIASDFRKPFGITQVKNICEFLEDLPVQKMSGIGRVARARLNTCGVKTIGDLARYDTCTLLEHFGKWGLHFQRIARGLDSTGVNVNRGIAKSVSRERTFQEDRDIDECNEVISKLCKVLKNDLKKLNYKTVSIKIRYSNFSTITRDRSLGHHHNDEGTIKKIAMSLIDKVSRDKKVRLLGIKLSNLCLKNNIQRTLLDY